MVITATQNGTLNQFKATWNEDLTACNYTAIGLDDETVETLIANKVHEGVNFEGWSVNVEL